MCSEIFKTGKKRGFLRDRYKLANVLSNGANVKKNKKKPQTGYCRTGNGLPLTVSPCLSPPVRHILYVTGTKQLI